jgi:hypothetical protein
MLTAVVICVFQIKRIESLRTRAEEEEEKRIEKIATATAALIRAR